MVMWISGWPENIEVYYITFISIRLTVRPCFHRHKSNPNTIWMWYDNPVFMVWVFPSMWPSSEMYIFWLAWKMRVHAMISVRLACQFYVAKNFNVAVFLDTIKMINVKLRILVVLIELYPFIPFSVALNVFQTVLTDFFVVVLIQLTLCMIVNYIK